MRGRLAWPWPGDSALDRARRVALSYRQALLDRYPDAAMDLDDQFADWGETWVAPTMATVNLDDEVTIIEAAEHVGLSAKAIYNWVYAKKLESKLGNDSRLRVKLGDVIEVNRRIRQGRARRAQRGRPAGAA